MNYYEKIQKILNKNNGYITTKEVTDNNIPRIYLTKMVESKKIVRINRGHYTFNDILVDDFYRMINKSKNAIYSHNTALYFHDLSDRTPLRYDITVPSGYNGSLQKDINVNLFYVKKDLLNLGLTTLNSPLGQPVKVYDIERTVCDVIKNRNKIDKEILSKALKNYSNLKGKDLSKLVKYAEKLGIKKKVMEYMEALL
ncbi:MAG: type IV toxin-antitoxin system AbiEi family antitoxin domain-containing protein [Bacilli bacterium]|nr:type IV toxin-antitoxin system AbiEi family antitoxin domain-containing protein [Bacilli bacterium]